MHKVQKWRQNKDIPDKQNTVANRPALPGKLRKVPPAHSMDPETVIYIYTTRKHRRHQ